jgi:hypothetical protein
MIQFRIGEPPYPGTQEDDFLPLQHQHLDYSSSFRSQVSYSFINTRLKGRLTHQARIMSVDVRPLPSRKHELGAEPMERSQNFWESSERCRFRLEDLNADFTVIQVSVQSLFSVNGLVAVVTGGGTGESKHLHTFPPRSTLNMQVSVS